MTSWKNTKVVERRKYASTTPFARIRRLGSQKSSQKCVRRECGKRLTRLAVAYRDPYCSRVCQRLVLGIPELEYDEIFAHRAAVVRRIVGGTR